MIHKHEQAAADTCELMPGAGDLLGFLDTQGIAYGLWTRNSPATVAKVFDRFQLKKIPVIDRSFSHPKPDPAGLLYFQRLWNIPSQHMALVDDQPFALKAAQKTGFTSVLLATHKNKDIEEFQADHIVESLLDLLKLL